MGSIGCSVLLRIGISFVLFGFYIVLKDKKNARKQRPTSIVIWHFKRFNEMVVPKIEYSKLFLLISSSKVPIFS